MKEGERGGEEGGDRVDRQVGGWHGLLSLSNNNSWVGEILFYKPCTMCILHFIPLSSRLLFFAYHQSVGPGFMTIYHILSKHPQRHGKGY